MANWLDRYQDGKWVTPVDPLDPLTYRAIRMWPTYDSLVTHMLKFSFKSYVKWHGKNQIWNNTIDFFRIQNWSHEQNSWEWNLWTPHAAKQLINKVVSWFHTSDSSVHSTGPRFTHLSDTNIFFQRTRDLLKIWATFR